MLRAVLVILMLFVTTTSWAAQVAQVSPTGTVSVVSSVKITFDTDAIAFGDSQAAAPAKVTCDSPAVEGSGRWVDTKRWTYVFHDRLGPGVHCTVDIDAAFRTLDKQPITGKTRFTFNTGGPHVRDVRPYGYSRIAEDQMFVLAFNGDVAPATLAAHSVCLVAGMGEAVPVRVISGKQRDDVLAATLSKRRYDARGPWVQVVQCKRRLPADAKMALHVGPGVATPSGVATTQPEVFKYQVRPPFTASFSCRRENAHAPCTPVLPITLNFSAPVARADARKVRIKTVDGERSPTIAQAPGEAANGAADGTASGSAHGAANSVEENGPDGGYVDSVTFKGPFPPDADVTITLPAGLKDDSGRSLSNAGRFPLVAHMAPFPPLVKFAKSPFGVIERFGEVPVGGDEKDNPPSVPVTVRNVGPELVARGKRVSAGSVHDYVTQNDADVLHWYTRVKRLGGTRLTRRQIDAVMHDRKLPPWRRGDTWIDTRGVPALAGQNDVRKLTLPAPGNSALRPFEVIGVPVPQLGFHVIEIESPRLGKSLLKSGKPMYVRTTALVTNLGVHIKWGRDDVLAWVTTLDKGKVVPNADITVLDCHAKVLFKGKTNEQGIWHHRTDGTDITRYCDNGISGIYVSARIGADNPAARGKADFAFAMSNWNGGIETWRFNVPTDTQPEPTEVVHTVYDRPLFHVGETVSMKHFIRIQTRDGLAVPGGAEDGAPLPDRVEIMHEGSGDTYKFPIDWKKTPTGGPYALSRFKIPQSARLGTYSVTFKDGNGNWYGSSTFRVAAFKLPVYKGTIKVSDKAGSGILVAPAAVHADIQMSYVSGGPASKLPVTLSGVAQENWLYFDDYAGYQFNLPEESNPDLDDDYSGADPADTATHDAQSLFLNKKSVTLDGHGGARVALDTVPPVTRPRQWLFEASYPDPNGEIQTLSHTVQVWPADVVVGIDGKSWVRQGKQFKVKLVALSPAGVPRAGVPVQVDARRKTTYSTRKRMVGGFYSYDNHVAVKKLGTLCKGTTDDRGELSCTVTLDKPGSIELTASAKDKKGRVARAMSTTWVTSDDGMQLWFGGSNDDRMDVIPEKKTYKPGDVAQFQVRMPFREATALVDVEREGVLWTRVVHLSGDNPTISIPVDAAWGPNVYVSVLALRGRVRDVPWLSFFTDGGWKHPMGWYDDYTRSHKRFRAPTPFVDLSKPSFRLGLTEIKVSDEREQLDVNVSADKKVYQVRGKAVVTVRVTRPDGSPAANGQVAFAAVDEALLELAPNDSWDILAAMRRERSDGVRTATAQLQVVGRRHYGRKAQPAGGGGGKSPTRELLDTLLMWKPVVQLDKDGRAQITVPLNDAITRFRLVAIADYGAERFGTGSTDIRVTQDLQAISGLPALIREDDRYQAMVTVRNSTTRDMKVAVEAGYSGKGIAGQSLPQKTVNVAAGAAQLVVWNVTAPQAYMPDHHTRIDWKIRAHELGKPTGDAKPASDALLVHQKLVPSVPVAVRQAMLVGVDGAKPAVSLPVHIPKGALLNGKGQARGGLRVALRSSLAGGMPGVRQWFSVYPYTCLEQLTSRAIGMDSPAQWAALMEKLPNYLDADGLAMYFPGPGLHGSEVLTAYILVASDEAARLGLPFALPASAKQAMLDGLRAYAQGRIVRHRWAPQKDQDVRKLLVIEALAHYGQASARMLDSIKITPNRWPTSAVIDWLSILRRMPGIAQRDTRLAQARQVVMARLVSRGTSLVFPDDSLNNWWWLMGSRSVNSAKLLLTVIGQPGWDADIPRIAQGLIGLQTRGAWRTTTANLMGSLALERFAKAYETDRVSGTTHIYLEHDKAGSGRRFDWDTAKAVDGIRSSVLKQPWPASGKDDLVLEQRGKGVVWATVQSRAAVPVVKPIMAGYRIQRTVVPVSRAVPGKWSRGDVYRVKLRIVSKTPTIWAVVSDPIPAGATILGGGLGRDSAIATRTEQAGDWWNRPSFVERRFDAYRAYYEYLPQGVTNVEYTVRLNTVGTFHLPPTRVEAMYQPDVFGEAPNLKGMTVLPRQFGDGE
jgi:uncharacterized protein YfaS (alpha-2-macroglobulin family)